MNSQDVLNGIFVREASVSNFMKAIQAPSLEEKDTALGFLLDVCTSSKSLQTDAKHDFFTRLFDAKLIPLLLKLLTLKPSDIPTTCAAPAALKPGTASVLRHQESGVGRLELLKMRAVECLTDCLQTIPSTVKLVVSSL
jgi:hypothetical protein